MLAVGALVAASVSGAEAAPVGLGTADAFAVLAAAGVTNTGPTIIDGDLGTCPTPAITGFPPGTVNGTVHAGDAVCLQAQSDLTIAYNDAAGRAPTTVYPGVKDLGGLTLTPGVYKADAFENSGTLTLDAQGDPNAVFIFQAGSTLITAPTSSGMLINGAQACNVFWQVGSSATLGVGSTFVGTILALTSITANTNASVTGRLLARNGAVTLDSNTVTRPVCLPVSTTTSSTSTSSTSTSTSTTVPPTTITIPPITIPPITVPPAETTTTSSTTTTAPPPTTTPPRAPAGAGGTGTAGGGGTETPTTSSSATVPAATNTAGSTTTSTSPTVGATTGISSTTTVAPTTTTMTAGGAGVSTATTVGGGEATSARVGTRTLARTGSSVRWWQFAAGLALALGGLMVQLTRREPPTTRREPDPSS